MGLSEIAFNNIIIDSTDNAHVLKCPPLTRLDTLISKYIVWIELVHDAMKLYLIISNNYVTKIARLII